MTALIAWALSPAINVADFLCLAGAAYFAIIVASPRSAWPAWYMRIFK